MLKRKHVNKRSENKFNMWVCVRACVSKCVCVCVCACEARRHPRQSVPN
jgi:hypothetical protein